MGKFIKGDIVVINFPFSNLSGSKRRPALVLADLYGDDIILCQITSSSKTDNYSVKLETNNFVDGKLSVESVVRPNKIFTADKNIILYTVCKISEEKSNQVINTVTDIMNGQTKLKKIAKGKIIFLNGVSSSGKTTLAKVLQNQLEKPYYIINIDTFLGTNIMFPEKFKTFDDAGFDMFCNTLTGMHHVIKLYSDLGMNTIVDHVLLNKFIGDKNPKSFEECVELLHEYPVFFVHVICPLNELRRREKERGDRYIGQAEDNLSALTPQDTYDITIDTHKNSTVECADKIIELLDYPKKWTAFKTLWAKLIKE